MKTYLYCADAAWDTSRPVRAAQLTPRCWFCAETRREAREIFEEIERALWPRGRQFGAAAFRAETARERRRISGAPSEHLPECWDWIGAIQDRATGEEVHGATR